MPGSQIPPGVAGAPCIPKSPDIPPGSPSRDSSRIIRGPGSGGRFRRCEHSPSHRNPEGSGSPTGRGLNRQKAHPSGYFRICRNSSEGRPTIVESRSFPSGVIGTGICGTEECFLPKAWPTPDRSPSKSTDDGIPTGLKSGIGHEPCDMRSADPQRDSLYFTGIDKNSYRNRQIWDLGDRRSATTGRGGINGVLPRVSRAPVLPIPGMTC
jgi:hypothetical protein